MATKLNQTGFIGVQIETKRLESLLQFLQKRTGLAFVLEKYADRAADSLFDFDVSVEEAKTQMAREVAADGGLAAAGHADQGNEHVRV